jgi:phosphoglycolate phosphatase-like HAD superfamily hydrolase
MPGVATSNPSRVVPHVQSFKTRPDFIPTVFCDFDGPIINVSERYYCTYRLAIADVKAAYLSDVTTCLISPLSKQHFWQMKQERVPDLEIAMRSGLQLQYIDYFLERVNQLVNQPTLLCQDQLQPNVRQALAMLHQQGVRLVLVTLRDQMQAAQILDSHDLLRFFDAVRGVNR